MLGIGLVKKTEPKRAETPEGRRAAREAARPPVIEKELPPPFEAPARGKVVESRARAVAPGTCVDCGARLQQRMVQGATRCPECASDHV